MGFLSHQENQFNISFVFENDTFLYLASFSTLSALFLIL